MSRNPAQQSWRDQALSIPELIQEARQFDSKEQSNTEIQRRISKLETKKRRLNMAYLQKYSQPDQVPEKTTKPPIKTKI